MSTSVDSAAPRADVENELKVWIEADEKRVTLGRMAEAFSWTAPASSSLLRDKMNESKAVNITFCQQIKKGNTTTFRMRSTNDKKQIGESDTICALAPAGCQETYRTTMDKEFVKWRGRVDEGLIELVGTLSIAPAAKVRATVTSSPQPSPRNAATGGSKTTNVKEPITNPASGLSKFASSSSKKQVGKKTTPKDFFGAHAKATKRNTSPPKSKSSPPLESKSSPPPSSKKSLSTKTRSKASKSTSSNLNTKSKAKTASSPDEKKLVGDADDFVGDMDDDDDSDDDVAVMEIDTTDSVEKETPEDESSPSSASDESPLSKKGKSKKKKKVAKPSSPIATVYGAMDDFCSQAPKPKPAAEYKPHPKRRKVKKDETTVDEKGYLVTKTVYVWEEIPSDEEDPHAEEEEMESTSNTETASMPKKKRPAPKKKAVKKEKPLPSSQNMKQKSLMGFFGKKK